MQISDKLTKIDDDFTIRMYDNGFLFEANGRDDEDNWANIKVVCNSLDEVIDLIKEATQMERA